MARRFVLAAVLLLSGSLVTAGDSSLIEDFSSFPYLWTHTPNVRLDNPAIPAGDPLALPGQQGSERILAATGPQKVSVELTAHACREPLPVVIAVLLSTPAFDARQADPSTITLGREHAFRYEHRGHGPKPRLRDVDHDGDVDLVLFFHGPGVCAGGDADPAFNGRTWDGRWFTAGGSGARFDRPFAASSDWSLADGLKFWFNGRGSGDTIKVQLRDNRAPDPGPAGWRLVWHEEFSGPAGQPPDPSRWSAEVGDGTAQGIPGWGNNEREYYTDRPQNAALDGQGHLVITAARADGSMSCYYGPCEFTSARLKTQDKVEIGHGRIEARIKVPAGAGLWPAFWALGSDLGQVGWPASGEIDVMEYVGRKPNEVSGALHGPGYSGGAAISGQTLLASPVADDYHVFAIEWQQGEIDWLVDGTVFHHVSRADLSGKQWVFDKPFFMIVNLAVGGFLGGDVGSDVSFPRTLLVDYIRVFQAPDTAERFEASFVDSSNGWREVALPFSTFSRSERQPQGAPNDGLTLSEVWGYGFSIDDGVTANPLRLDKVRLIKPTSVVVRSLQDSGRGSLRDAVGAVADGGSVGFDPALAGGTITLASGPLWISGKAVTVDGSAAPGLTLRGAGSDRLLIVDPGAKATLRSLTLADGFAWDLAGGILTNGDLVLDHVVVRDNTVMAGAGDWWKGGGGIYVGGGASLDLRDSTVRDNRTVYAAGASGSLDGGGIYTFQNSTMHVDRSTLSGNSAANVGGGIRMLGSGSIVNSTLSGNTAVGWYGGAIFHTDGVLGLVNSTVADNHAPPWAAAALFVGTFTDASATLSLVNTIVADNQDFGCFVAPWGGGTVILASGGHNVFTDGSCSPGGTDQVVGEAGLGPLGDNGGPTATQALLPGSPAIDAGDPAVCPAVDQRGIPRPQGPTCDVGAVEQQAP